MTHVWYRFAMHELGLSSKKPFKKCARVVGEVSLTSEKAFDFHVQVTRDFVLYHYLCKFCESDGTLLI